MSIWDQAAADGVWLVGVTGRLEQTQTPQLEERLLGLLGEGRQQLVVDLSDVSYINSGGLRCLVSAWRHAREREGDLYLCCLSDRVQEVFTMVGFDKVFRIFPTRETALAAWRTSD